MVVVNGDDGDVEPDANTVDRALSTEPKAIVVKLAEDAKAVEPEIGLVAVVAEPGNGKSDTASRN